MTTEFYLEIKQDEDKDITLQWFKSDGITPDSFDKPVRVECEIRDTEESKEYILRLDSENDDIDIDDKEGKIVLHFTAEKTKNLDFNTAKMDIVLTERFGTDEARITRDLRGVVKLIKKITERQEEN